MTLSDTSITPLLLSLWKVHSPRFSLFSLSNILPAPLSLATTACLSNLSPRKSFPPVSLPDFHNTCHVTLWPTLLLFQGSHRNCSHRSLLWLCLAPVSPSRLSTPGRQGQPSGLLLQKAEWPQAPAATLICVHHGVRTRPPSFPWAVSNRWPRSARNADHSCQTWGSSDRRLQGFPVHLAKTFSETGCSPRLLLPRLLPSLSPS